MRRCAFPLLVLALVVVGSALPASMAAQEANVAVQDGWQYGPEPPFQYQRHDAVFVPGADGEPWANRVYFFGGRTSASTELPDIWSFDPAAGSYSDTGVDMVEDVSNYNGNLILDDGTGRGPAVYVVGGYDRDQAGANIGMVQRYYPQANLIEALPSADDWPVAVAGYKVGGMGTAVVDDIIYVFGGWESNAPPYFSAATWAFDPKQPSGSRWTDPGVVDQYDIPLARVAVDASIWAPDSGPHARSRFTKPSGFARFHWGSTASGTWTLCVDNLALEGYVYAPGDNVVTCMSWDN